MVDRVDLVDEVVAADIAESFVYSEYIIIF